MAKNRQTLVWGTILTLVRRKRRVGKKENIPPTYPQNTHTHTHVNTHQPLTRITVILGIGKSWMKVTYMALNQMFGDSVSNCVSSVQLESTNTRSYSLQYSHFSCIMYMKWNINKYATYYFFLLQSRLIFIKVCIEPTKCWYWNMNLDRIYGIQDWYLIGKCNWILNLSSNMCHTEKYFKCLYALIRNI